MTSGRTPIVGDAWLVVPFPRCVDVGPDRWAVRVLVRALFGDDVLLERRLAVRREVQRYSLAGRVVRDAPEDANRVLVDDRDAREADAHVAREDVHGSRRRRLGAVVVRVGRLDVEAP
jgi:hypothetical protein